MATLTDAEKKATDKIIKHLKKTCSEQLVEVILYGSKARGDYSAESDIDILVIVRNRNHIDRDKIYDFLLDDDIDYNLNFSLNIYGVNEFQRLVAMKAPFVMNVLREGETLWTS